MNLCWVTAGYSVTSSAISISVLRDKDLVDQGAVQGAPDLGLGGLSAPFTEIHIGPHPLHGRLIRPPLERRRRHDTQPVAFCRGVLLDLCGEDCRSDRLLGEHTMRTSSPSNSRY